MIEPQRYAVIGNPVAHSRSPQIHAQFARQTGELIEYGRLFCELGRFKATVDEFRRSGGRGLNVTLPFKLEACAYASRLSQRAHLAGAVNTLKFDGDEVLGENTDGVGLVNDLGIRLAQKLDGARVLIIGAGGATRGVLLPLLEAGVAHLLVCNRTPAKAQELAGLFAEGALLARGHGERIRGAGFDELQDVRLSAFDVIINATSTGLADAALPIPRSVFVSARLAYDMVYAPRPTRFMTQAHEAGCPRTSDGLGMLVEQAAESFLIWRGVRPDTAAVYSVLRAELDAAG